MSTHGTSRMDRILALVLSIVMIIGMIPANIVVASDADYGTVEGLTPGAALGGDAAKPVLTYDSVELDWVDVDASQGRTKAGWYIGVRLNAPETMRTEADYISGENQVTIQTKGMSGWSSSLGFWENQNSDKTVEESARFIDAWYYLDESRVITGKLNGSLEFGLQADWNMDGEFEQVVTVKINPNGVTLNKGGVKVFPVIGAGTVSVLNSDGSINESGTITGNGTDYVTVTPAATTYEWCEATADRTTAGWWAGIRVDIPEGMTETQLENVQYKLNGTAGSFWADHETDANGVPYITLWKSLNKLEADEKLSVSKMEFDWNNDGVFEQMVVFSVDPDKVTLMKEDEQVFPKRKVTVSVAVDGSAAVEINGVLGNTATVVAGSDVSLKITPNKGSYIKELVVGTQTVSVPKGQAYEGTIQPDEDIAISVKTVKEFTVTVNEPAAVEGSVTLNGEQTSSVVVDDGTKVLLKVSAEKDYWVSTVTVNGESTEVNGNSYETEIAVTANTDITVAFVRIYTVKVSSNENGEITSDPELTGGSVTVANDSEVVVTADPSENYRVSEVTINGVADKDPMIGQNFGDEDVYTKTLSVDQDYTVVVVFAPNRFNVQADATIENGKVTINPAIVEYGKTAEVTITPDKGYSVSTVLINGDALENTPENEAIKIDNITEDKTILVTFVATETAELKNVTFNDTEAVKTDSQQKLYVFANGANVTFETEKSGIKLYDTTGKLIGAGENTVTIDESQNIGRISLLYKAEKEFWMNWHDVAGVSKENPLQIVIDTVAPVFGDNTLEDKIYKDEVVFEIEVSDDYSGVDTVTYEYRSSGKKTADYNAETGTATIVVERQEGLTGEEIAVTITATDKAENPSNTTVSFQMDTVAPKVSVKFENNTPRNLKYFKEARKLIVTITEKNFDKDAATAAIQLYKDGATESLTPSLVKWTSIDDVHTATILLDQNGSYAFSMDEAYQDLAGNTGNITYDSGNVAGDAFVIDIGHKPSGKATVEFKFIDEEDQRKPVEYTDLEEESLTYELWANASISIEISAEDIVSGVEPIHYYIDYYANGTSLQLLTEEVLDKLKGWMPYNGPVVINDNSRFVVYVQVIDKAGNVTYISTNGLIVDNKKPSGDIEKELDVIVDHPKENNETWEEKLYNIDGEENVPVTVTVYDPKYLGKDYDENGSFSGLETITGVIKSDNGAEEEVVLFSTDSANQVSAIVVNGSSEKDSDGLVYKWTGTVLVNKEKFNGNDISVEIAAVDNAQNVGIGSTSIAVDVTSPTITVSFDDVADSEKYFKEARRATITVTERNFDYNDFSFVYLRDGNSVTVTIDAKDWSETPGTGNGDTTTHTAYYDFEWDADYLLDGDSFTCPDRAGNPLAGVTFTGPANTDFTVDTKAPQVSVSYDNNSAENEKYFKDHRTATVTIIEHNLPSYQDLERIVFTQTAGRGGEKPQVSWSNTGDTHTATFVYDKDGDYTFDVSITDLAGNKNATVDYGTSVAPKDFIVDTTYEDMVSQSGVENGVAYGYDADVIPSVKIFDINLQEYEVTLTGIQKDKTIDLTEEVNELLTEETETVTGIFDIFETKQDLDGIYTLKLYSKDKAGNEDSLEIVFTVNRFGSVYVFDDYLLGLIKDGGAFVKKVDNDLIITEYNADKLVADSLKIEITVDGRPLDNVQYTVTPEINDTASTGSSGWYQYTYTISKNNFTADGVYKISVSSEDATGNTPENNNYAELGISFRVDSTKAEITSVVGLEEDIINAQEVTVQYTVFDTIGLKNIKVYVDGNVVDEITDFTADRNNYSGSFTLKESSSAQNVKIVVEDLAGNVTDTSAKNFAPAYAFNGSVTVSTNIFVRWYANKALFWGSIGGFVVLVAAIIAVIVAKKKKKAAAAK